MIKMKLLMLTVLMLRHTLKTKSFVFVVVFSFSLGAILVSHQNSLLLQEELIRSLLSQPPDAGGVSDVVVSVALLGASVLEVDHGEYEIGYDETNDERDDDEEEERNDADGREQRVQNVGPAVERCDREENEHSVEDVVEVVVAVDDVADFCAGFVRRRAACPPVACALRIDLTRQSNFASCIVDAPDRKGTAKQLDGENRKNKQSEDQHDENGREFHHRSTQRPHQNLQPLHGVHRS